MSHRLAVFFASPSVQNEVPVKVNLVADQESHQVLTEICGADQKGSGADVDSNNPSVATDRPNSCLCQQKCVAC